MSKSQDVTIEVFYYRLFQLQVQQEHRALECRTGTVTDWIEIFGQQCPHIEQQEFDFGNTKD